MAKLKFLADMPVPVAAIDVLRKKGVHVVRTLEVGFEEDEDDLIILEYATQHGYIIITCDVDFEQKCYQWMAEGKQHTSILYLNMSTGDCQNVGLIVEWVETINGASDPDKEYVNQIWRAK
jgi:predicted nuclease of predicted toxin-antitoxin system